jgi:hypothetical protein
VRSVTNTAANAIGQAPSAERRPPERRPPSRRRIAVGALVLIVLFVVQYVARYQPLADSMDTHRAMTLTGARSQFLPGAPGRSVANVLGDEVTVGPYPHGGRYGVTFRLANNGRFPVVVTGVEPEGDQVGGPPPRLFVATDRRQSEPSDYVPARPFTIAPHHSRAIALAVSVRPGCAQAAAQASATTLLRVHYRFAGLPHSASVQFQGFALLLADTPAVCLRG